MAGGQRVSTGMLLQAILSVGILGVALFLPAGEVRWGRGWIFLLFFLAWVLASIFYLWRANPEIFFARSKVHEGTKGWDKVLITLLLAAFMAIFPVAGLDAVRMRWSSVPGWVIALGYVLFSIGMAGSIWVLRVNRFAEPGVRIQKDRGQKVIDSGPYAIVRHPLYLSAFFVVAGIPLALGSLWALVPAAVGVPVIVVRTALEDRLLREELEGYREYAGRVRYRLVPGVW